MSKDLIKLPTAGLVVIQENKLLLAFSKNKRAWYLPGGKVDAGETSIQSIVREIQEELNVELDLAKLSFYTHISAPAFGEESNIIMEQDCFLYELKQEIQPSNEIESVAFFSLEDYQKQPAQVVGVLDVFTRLKADGLI